MENMQTTNLSKKTITIKFLIATIWFYFSLGWKILFYKLKADIVREMFLWRKIDSDPNRHQLSMNQVQFFVFIHLNT